MQKHWYLQQIDLFRDMSDEEVMAIAGKMTEKKCVKKEIIYAPADTNDSIYVVKKGEVTLYDAHGGKRLIIEVLRPGSLFGNIGCTRKTATHFAEASENSLLCLFSGADFGKILSTKPELMLRFLEIVSERMRNYEKRLKGGLFDAKEKIKQQLEIMNDSRKQAGVLNRLFGVSPKLTHDRLAELTGLSRETVTRAVNDLKKAGMNLPL